jgi:hypothetical protein
MHCVPHIAAAMFARLAGLLRESEILARSSSRAAPIRRSRASSRLAPPPSRITDNILQKLQVSRRGQAAARLRESHDS